MRQLPEESLTEFPRTAGSRETVSSPHAEWLYVLDAPLARAPNRCRCVLVASVSEPGRPSLDYYVIADDVAFSSSFRSVLLGHNAFRSEVEAYAMIRKNAQAAIDSAQSLLAYVDRVTKAEPSE